MCCRGHRYKLWVRMALITEFCYHRGYVSSTIMGGGGGGGGGGVEGGSDPLVPPVPTPL